MATNSLCALGLHQYGGKDVVSAGLCGISECFHRFLAALPGRSGTTAKVRACSRSVWNGVRPRNRIGRFFNRAKNSPRGRHSIRQAHRELRSLRAR
jgi:hypothetical protein